MHLAIDFFAIRQSLLWYLMRILPTLFLFLISCSTLSLPGTAWADATGSARVIDGDTLFINGIKIRLLGIDAPELEQTCKTRRGNKQNCGKMAKQALQQIVLHQRVVCKGDRRDHEGQRIAVCRVGPFKINEQMVLNGWALAYRRESEDYVRAETVAKARHEGIWKTDFMAPWEWRKANP